MQQSISPNISRRIVTTLFITQCFGSAALIANATVNPIVGAELSGREELAGLPGTLLLIGAAVAAPWAGRLMGNWGRRWGLTLGFVVGAIGMVIGGVAIVTHAFLLLLLGLLLIGGARGAVDQSRYAAADAQLPARRARAISTVVFAGTIGAIAGPALVRPSGFLLTSIADAPLAGPMWVGAALFALAGLLIFLFLRPDPRDIGRAIAEAYPDTQHPEGLSRPLRVIASLPAFWLALLAMVIAQVVMVLIMSVTSLHMHHHDHGLEDVSLVIAAHTLGMYGLSVVNGWLIDRIGRRMAIAAGAAVLIGGALLAPISLMTQWLALALFLIGLGWNLCYISGSSLLSDILAPAERARVQGVNELVVNLSSAASSLLSGVILAYSGYAVLSTIGATLAFVPLLALGAYSVSRSRKVTPVAIASRSGD